MSLKKLRIRRFNPFSSRKRAVSAIAATLSMLSVVSIVLAQSNFVDINNHLIRWSGTGTFDWGNGPTSAGSVTTSNTGVVHAPGTNGIFDGGVYNGTTTVPTPPGKTITATNDSSIVAAVFIPDFLSVDKSVCGTGDPTSYTGAGSETNGGVLSTDTWGTSSVPNKDDLENVYAVAHRTAGVNEIFFGAERVVNNGDSHIDFEFLQAKNVRLVTVDKQKNIVHDPAVPPPAGSDCSGQFRGDRTQGDFLLSVDFTTGGTFGDTIFYKWYCDTTNPSGFTDGTVCNTTGNKGAFPNAAYSQTSQVGVTFGVNGAGNISGGGWASRNADGTQTTTILQNAFMEGGIDLNEVGFTGCVNTFLPHTRSAQSFTSVLKDFALVAFDTCRTPTVSTTLASPGIAPSASITVTTGTPVTDTALLSGTIGVPTGTVTYTVYSNNTCTNSVSTTNNPSVVTLNVDGSVPPSAPITLTQAGTFYWQAVYSGDGFNLGPVSSPCGSEVEVVKANPTIATLLTAVVTDTATLSTTAATASGTLTYTIYTSNTCAAGTEYTGTVPNFFTVTVSGSGKQPPSGPFLLNAPGTNTYFWQAVYSGDGLNNSAVSACTDEQLTLKNPNP